MFTDLVEPESPEVVDHIVEGLIEAEDPEYEGAIMPKVERIELRVDAHFESEFRRYSAMRGVGRTEEEQATLRRRVLDKIVFVGLVGQGNEGERWLVERKGEKKEHKEVAKVEGGETKEEERERIETTGITVE